MTAPAPHLSGAPTPAALAARLTAAGWRASWTVAESLEDLAQATDAGGWAVLCVNAGVLWGDPRAVDGGEANHCVVALTLTDTGAAVDDPARPGGGPVPTDVLVAAWLRTGGRMLTAE